MGCMGSKLKHSAWEEPGDSSGVQQSQEASPTSFASAGPFPTAYSQGAASPKATLARGFSPSLGLTATPGPLRVLPPSGPKVGPKEDPA